MNAPAPTPNQPDPTTPVMQESGEVINLRPPSRWHDPLQLIQTQAPDRLGRIVLWAVSLLILILLFWAYFGQLDIIASAEGKLVPQTLLKIVQPAEAGVVRQLLVNEGDSVKAGQVLARLDPSLARADHAGLSSDLAVQELQVRRLEAELAQTTMLPKKGDDVSLFAQVHNQYLAHRQAYQDSLQQETALLQKAQFERKSAAHVLSKLEQTLPVYKNAAEAYQKLEKEGFLGGLVSAEKQREALEKLKDRDAQLAAVAALDANLAAAEKRISQLKSNYQSVLEKELAEVRARIAQLQPNLSKSNYKTSLLELKAPQDGTIKDLATTSVGAVVQPGNVVMTLLPKDEALFVDIAIKNEDVGFVQVGQRVQIKLAAYPFQRHGMLHGKVIRISVDANEASANAQEKTNTATISSYKARVQLEQQKLLDPQGQHLILSPGMQAVAEIMLGKQTVMQYLLSPVRKAVSEAGRER